MENFSTIANCQAASEKIKVFKKYIAAVERRRASTFREVRELTGLSEGSIAEFIDNDKNNDKLTAYQDKVLSKFIEQRKFISPQHFNLTSSPTMSQNISNMSSIDTSTSSLKRTMSQAKSDSEDDCIYWDDEKKIVLPKKIKIEPVESIENEKQEFPKSTESDDDLELTFNQTQELDAIERKHKESILATKNTNTATNIKPSKKNVNKNISDNSNGNKSKNKTKKQENICPSSAINKEGESIGLESALSLINH